mmetsp:Transcript_89586/g.252523  ORF Transcript_89586/g.252523 Transcript_89586/m.252523 type:complete len:214 (-) Transcript_89586:1-642(-)
MAVGRRRKALVEHLCTPCFTQRLAALHVDLLDHCQKRPAVHRLHQDAHVAVVLEITEHADDIGVIQTLEAVHPLRQKLWRQMSTRTHSLEHPVLPRRLLLDKVRSSKGTLSELIKKVKFSLQETHCMDPDATGNTCRSSYASSWLRRFHACQGNITCLGSWGNLWLEAKCSETRPSAFGIASGCTSRPDLEPRFSLLRITRDSAILASRVPLS